MAEAPGAMYWPKGEKGLAIEIWAKNVWSDVRVSKGELRLAWALTFSFHSTERRCWETKSSIARRTGVSLQAVKNDLNALEKHGHIMRLEEDVKGANLRVIRPVFNRDIENQPQRKRRGGIGSVKSGTEPQSEKSRPPTEVQSGGGLNLSTKDRLRFRPHVTSEVLSSEITCGVEGMTTGGTVSHASDDFNEDDLPF